MTAVGSTRDPAPSGHTRDQLKDAIRIVSLDSVEAYRSMRVFPSAQQGFPFSNIYAPEGPGVVMHRYWAADRPGSGLDVTLISHQGAPIDAGKVVAGIDAAASGSGIRPPHVAGRTGVSSRAPKHHGKLFFFETIRKYFDAVGRAWD